MSLYNAVDSRLGAHLDNAPPIPADDLPHVVSGWVADDAPSQAGEDITLKDASTITLAGGGKVYVVQAQLYLTPKNGTDALHGSLDHADTQNGYGLAYGVSGSPGIGGVLYAPIFGWVPVMEDEDRDITVSAAIIGGASGPETLDGGGIDILRVI